MEFEDCDVRVVLELLSTYDKESTDLEEMQRMQEANKSEQQEERLDTEEALDLILGVDPDEEESSG